ncbi:MAG: tRNA threonylcarbamoyladenosine dehydratase [Magnetococcales bacterium]|nr:tRNA threonylcarbamoyladenosine dehydratase [Magnetococcales bacterium]
MSTAGIFERTEVLVGEAGIKQLRQARVLLCGLGGVGSFAGEALSRAGIGHLTLIDSDRVSPSNINRQLPALGSTVGEKKVQVMAERLREINPDCQLQARDLFLDPDNIPELLEELQPHWVIDAIDSLNCKVNLIIEAQARKIPVASSMGAGGRLDPTRLVTGDLMDSEGCPLARVVRRRVRRRGGERGVVAVWSKEPAKPHLPPEPMERGRARAVNGTISYMPALFGLTLAGLVIQDILARESTPSPTDDPPPPQGST